jgi:alanine racemase
MAFIQIDKQNFYHNLNQIALKTGSVDKIAIVLKDNAYGHGLEIMAQLASEFGIGHAVVKNVEEAAAVKSLFRTVLVLSDTIVEDNVCSFAVNRLADLETAQRGAKVELKVDTGMHRNGIAMH